MTRVGRMEADFYSQRELNGNADDAGWADGCGFLFAARIVDGNTDDAD